jgi:hypothetical protein
MDKPDDTDPGQLTNPPILWLTADARVIDIRKLLLRGQTGEIPH